MPATHHYQFCFIPKQPTIIHIACRLITALSSNELTLEYPTISRL